MTIRVQATSDVRILYREVFLRVLARHPQDRHALKPFLDCEHDEVFPVFSVQNHPFFCDSGCSQEFFKFLQDHVEERIFPVGSQVILDEFQKNLQMPSPEGNISLCKINRGRMQIYGKDTGKNSMKVPLGECD